MQSFVADNNLSGAYPTVDLTGIAPEGMFCRQLETPQELAVAARLYTDVFGYSDQHFSVNPYLLRAMIRNGGSAVGVYAGELLVGFAFGFAATPYANNTAISAHYSQAAVVHSDYQGKGVGKVLKFAQAAVARAWGFETMRWTFNPKLTRNARFNFNTLGAKAINFLPDYYGVPGTDRLLVSWDLTSTAAQLTDPVAVTSDPKNRLQTLALPEFNPAQYASAVPESIADPAVHSAYWVPLPAVAGNADLSNINPARDPAHIAEELRETLTRLFETGHEIVSCVRRGDTAGYLAVAKNKVEK